MNDDREDLEIAADVSTVRTILKAAQKCRENSDPCVRCQVYACHSLDGLCRRCIHDDVVFPTADKKRNEPDILQYLWHSLKRSVLRKLKKRL